MLLMTWIAPSAVLDPLICFMKGRAMFLGGALSFGGDGGLSPGEDEKDAARTASERKMNRGSKRIVSVAAYCISLRGRVSTGNLRQFRLIDYDFGRNGLIWETDRRVFTSPWHSSIEVYGYQS